MGLVESRLNIIEQESSKASAADDLKCKDPDEKTAAEIINKKTVVSREGKGNKNGAPQA